MRKWLAAAVLWSGCALISAAEPGAGEKPAAEVSLPLLSELPVSTYLGGRDPLEGFNRTVFYGVDFFYYWVYRPVGGVYSSIIPRPGIRAINNFTDNLEFPRRFLSSLLQAKWTGSGIEVLRFLSNSTIGIGGLLDPAWHWFGLPRQDEDFGQAFAAWGIGPGCVLQLNNSSNIRDAVGMVFDYACDIKSYFYGGQAFTFLNRGLDAIGQYDTVRRSTFDSYQALKDYQLLIRYLQIHDWKPTPIYVDVDEDGKVLGMKARKPVAGEQITALPNFYPQSAEVDTLRVDWFQPSRESWWAHLSIFNTDFRNRATVRECAVWKDGAPLSYRYWLAEDPSAPLVMILPGLGSHNTSSTAQALAEICVRSGMSALIVSNTMNWEFVESTPGVPPGYAPDDAARLQDALEAVRDDLFRHEPQLAPERLMAAGYSQGALNALFLAEREAWRPRLAFDRYLAINPPVDLMDAMLTLDGYMRVMNDRDTGEAIGLLAAGAGSYLYSARQPSEMRRHYTQETNREKSAELSALKSTEKIDQVPLEKQVAQILIAYSFKRTLDDLLICMHHRAPVNGLKTPYMWGNRQALYDELATWGYLRYCMEVLVPYYSQRRDNSVSLQELNRQSGLRSIEKTLRNNERILVLHTADDFLLGNDDRAFLRETLGNRLQMFEYGGHLGNFYREEVQCAMLQFLQAPTLPITKLAPRKSGR